MNGRGMGLAKGGELNGHPGPTDVLDMGAELGLTQEQRAALAAIKDRMSAAAKPLGSEIIARERTLDEQFAAGRITKPELAALTSEIGALQARLRAIHLAAHLETKEVLSAAQVARYNELRGYGAGGTPAHDHAKGHGGRGRRRAGTGRRAAFISRHAPPPPRPKLPGRPPHPRWPIAAAPAAG